LKIWIGGEDVFGQSALLTEALESIGHECGGLLLRHSANQYPGDRQEVVGPDRYDRVIEETKERYHVFHVMGPNGRSAHREFQYAAEARKVRVVQFWGPDIRTLQTATVRNPYAQFGGLSVDQESTTAYLHELSGKVHACIVSDMESAAYVRSFFKRIYVLPYMMNAQLRLSSVETVREEPLIVHAPRSSNNEGTSFVLEVLERLKQDGFRFQAIVRQGLNDEERTELFKQADVVIDQLLAGAYGIASVEAMMLGKPALAYIRPDHLPDYPNAPVVSANPATLYRRLSELINASGLRTELGVRGVDYVRRVHHPERIASRLSWIYDREAKMLSGAMAEEEGVIHNLYVIDPEEASWKAEPVVSSSIRLYPNRILKRKKGVYVSFNLGAIPADAVISSAVMHLPEKKKRRAVSIFRITRGWDRRSVILRKRLPRTAKKSIKKLPLASRKIRRTTPRWECTSWARNWQSNQLNNHGVFVRNLSIGTPYLDVTVSTG
jgi:hypothetical protein